jgi:hypothetical protein
MHSEREKKQRGGRIQTHVVRSPIDHATKKTEIPIIELPRHVHKDWCQSCYAVLEGYEWPKKKTSRRPRPRGLYGSGTKKGTHDTTRIMLIGT